MPFIAGFGIFIDPKIHFDITGNTISQTNCFRKKHLYIFSIDADHSIKNQIFNQ
jgi:hypothetical protein